MFIVFFFFNDTATTEIYTLSLHDALPILFENPAERAKAIAAWTAISGLGVAIGPTAGGWLLEHFSWSSIFLVNLDRKSTRLNSSHANISYAVFCLKKKKYNYTPTSMTNNT